MAHPIPIPGAVDVDAVSEALRDFTPQGHNPEGGERLVAAAQAFLHDLTAAVGAAKKQEIAKKAKEFLDRN